MSSYAEALREFYNGEVGGETIYSALLETAADDNERLKWSTLLQLETETKAWLRAPMIAHELSIAEHMADRERATGAVAPLASLSWAEKMQAIQNFLSDRIVPQYQACADAAAERGEKDEEAVCLYMVEHEKAQAEFARRELAGESTASSLEPVVKFLRYPLTR